MICSLARALPDTGKVSSRTLPTYIDFILLTVTGLRKNSLLTLKRWKSSGSRKDLFSRFWNAINKKGEDELFHRIPAKSSLALKKPPGLHKGRWLTAFEQEFNILRSLGEKQYPFLLLPRPEHKLLSVRNEQRSMDSGSLLVGLKDLQSLEERIDAWMRLASWSSARKLDWKDERLRRLLSLICGDARQMTWHQLEMCVRYLSMVPRYSIPIPLALNELKNALDNECDRRLQIEISHHECTGVVVGQTKRFKLLSMANLWIVGSDILSELILDWNCSYAKTLTTFFLSQNCIDQLSSQEFVFMMFLVGLQRKFPITRNSGVNNHEVIPIPPYLLSKLEKDLPGRTCGEIGIVAHSLYLTNLKLHTKSNALKKLLLSTLIHIDERSILSEQLSISSICKLLKDSKTRETAEFDMVTQIIAFFKDKLLRMSPLTRIRLVNMTMYNRMHNYDFFIHSFAQSMKPELKDTRLKDLERLTFILYFFNYQKDITIYQDIQRIIHNCDRSHPRAGYDLVLLCSSLAKLGVLSEPHINEIFHTVNGSKLHQAEGEQECLEAGADMLLHLSVPPLKNHDRLLPQNREVPRALNLNALFHIAELDWNIEIDFPQYSDTRLDPKLRKKLTALSPFSKKLSTVGRVRQNVLTDLRLILGPSVYYGVVLPHAKIKDIFFCLDRSKSGNVAKELSNDFLEGMAYNVMIPSQTIGSWFVVLVAKKSHLDGSGNPLGPVCHKMRQMESIGYKTIIVPHSAYKPGKKLWNLHYLKRQIMKKQGTTLVIEKFLRLN